MTNETPRYDSDDDSVVEADVDNASVQTNELGSVYSVRISSASGLDNLDSNVTQGDVVYVQQPDAPYRTASWIDINTQNVTVVFESRWAKDGQAVVKPVDGADVGGIRIGTGATTIENVGLRNFGFDGNQSTMADSVKRLHGIIVDSAADVKIENCYATQTHPYQEHGSGGSGISVRTDAEQVMIEGFYSDDVGDRGVQAGGSGITVRDIFSDVGFDRVVALNYNDPDGNAYGANNVVVDGVIGSGITSGSVVGIGGSLANTPVGSYTISNVVAHGTHRSAVQLDNRDNSQGDIRNINVDSVVGVGGSLHGVALRQSSGSVLDNVSISNVVLRNYGQSGILFNAEFSSISSATIRGVTEDGILMEATGPSSENVISDVVIRGAGRNGVDNRGVGIFVMSGAVITQSGDHGVKMSDTFGQQHYYDMNVEGSTNADVDFAGSDHVYQGHFGSVNTATRSVVNGQGEESANAESPSSSWVPGTLVRFTDAGDGSGTGTYLIATDGSAVQLSGNT